MRSYFKSRIPGAVAVFVFFDDEDPEDMRLALGEARDAYGPDGTVSVWRRAQTVPTSIPEIGEVPARRAEETFPAWRERVEGQSS